MTQQRSDETEATFRMRAVLMGTGSFTLAQVDEQSRGLARHVVGPVLARAERAAVDLREIAETYLYDGDTDQPINDGYHALYVVAAALSGLSLQEERGDG